MAFECANFFPLCERCCGTGINRKIIAEENGSGEHEIEEPCSDCDGTGFLASVSVFLPDGVFPTYKLVECINADEYQALTVVKKDAVSLIVSCGTADLKEGKIRLLLDGIFPMGTQTHANILSLVGE